MTNHGQEAQTGFDAYLCSVRTSVIQLSGTNVKTLIWGCSSAGRAPALQAGGQGFDSLHLHQSGNRQDGKNRIPMSKQRSVAQVVRARA